MGCLIAIGGKGGVGKTTVAGMVVSRLIAHGRKPVLAVDADPNTCLDAVLGVRIEATVGGVREEARRIVGKGMPEGVSKQELLEMNISKSLVEAEDFDLLAMGRPEGQGCYCYANNVLKAALGRLVAQYPYIVLDNEAGLENLSRRIVRKVDLLIMVTDPSARGIETVKRLHALAMEMEIEYHRLGIVVNRLRHNELPDRAAAAGAALDADMVVGIPADDEITHIAEQGDSLLGLPHSSLISQRIDSLLAGLGVC